VTAGAAPEPAVVYGPHCSHDDCGWVTCDETGLVQQNSTRPGCPYCGALRNQPEDWASDPARFAAMTPADQDRARAYWEQYPLRRRGPDDNYARLSEATGACDEEYPAICHHDCDEDCDPDCDHQHCWNCGMCGCAGYCDDYQTYNLRPAETGGTEPAVAGAGQPAGEEL